MILKDISYSGIVKLTIMFVVIPRLISRLHYRISQPLFSQLENIHPTIVKPEVISKTPPQQIDVSSILTKELTVIITLLISAFVMTRVIEYLIRNTRVGDIKIGETKA